MARNNKNTYTYKTSHDLTKRAKEIKESQDLLTSQNKFEATIEDIRNVAEGILKGKNVIVNSNVGTVNSNKNKYKSIQANKNYEYSKVTKAIQQLNDNNFYNIISNKINSSEDMLIRTLQYSSDNNKKIYINNQKGKSNENLYSLNKKFDNFLNLKESNGTLFAYDLETIGGVDAHGIWRPTNITEFSMHEYGFDGSSNKVDVVLGINKKDMDKTLDRIEKALKDGSLEHDEELRVTASRLSLYGHDKVRASKTDKGYFKMDSFVDTAESDIYDIKRIRKGAAFFTNIYDQTDVLENGVKSDVMAMMNMLNYTKNKVNTGNSMLTGFNDSLFDTPIVNQIANKYIKENPALQVLFGNGFGFDINSDKHIDMMGAVQHYRNNFSTKDLMGDFVNNIDEKRLNRQEHYVAAFYAEQAKHLTAHEASSDVTALSYFFTETSDKLGGNTLFEFIGNKLKNVTNAKDSYDVLNGGYVFEAKKFTNGTFQGKNLLNFAYDKTNNNIYTADNHMIRDGKAVKKDFNVGVGINKGQFYKVNNLQRIEAGSQYLDIIQEAFPQYANNNMFALTLDMVTHDDYAGTRLDDLSQVLLFNSQTEVEAFLGNNLEAVAQETEEGIKLLNREVFDIREYDYIKNKPVYKDSNANYKKTDKELYTDAVKHRNQKQLTSRAENAINGDNAYRKITQALEIQTLAQKTVGRKLEARELNMIMSADVAAGKMPISIEGELIKKMQQGVSDILSWEGNLYDSTIDNMSTYMETIGKNELYYNKLISQLNKNDKFSKSSTEIKKTLFKRADRHLKEYLASELYDKDSRIKKSVLGDETLKAPLAKFKSMYELDLSALPGAKKDLYYDITRANPANLLRLDLQEDGLEYKLVKAVRDSIHGKKQINPNDVFDLEKKEFRKFIGMMLGDEGFTDSISKEFYGELKAIANDNKDYHHIDTADRIIKSISKIKEANPLTGIISKDLYMKDLTSSSSFPKALNSDIFLKDMGGMIDDFVNSTNLYQLNGSRDAAKSFVENTILNHYVPTNATELVHKKVTSEMTDYLTDIVHSIDKIGANISINDEGSITMYHKGEHKTLDIPRIQKDGDSGLWYIKAGNMQNRLINVLNTDVVSGGLGVDMSMSTTFGEGIGKYPIHKTIESFYESKGNSATIESMDQIEKLVDAHKKKIIKNSTINGFNGNDLDSNKLVDASSIANVLENVFGKNGKLNYLVKDKKFLDTNLQDILGEDVARYLKSGKPITELDANMNKDLIKNMEHLLNIIGAKATKDSDVEDVLKNISFTTSVKQMSSMVGIIGDMPYFSPQAPLDNVQRPPIIAAGNAIPIRMSAVKKIEEQSVGVVAGNIISTASIDKKTMRHVNGVGETTTDVMMNIAYVSTNALEVMQTNNMNKILAENNVDKNYKDHMVAMFSRMSKLNTYEQERHMDGRIAEQLYGLMPAKVQNISASKDINSAFKMMDFKEAKDQLDLITSLKGSFDFSESGVISYKSATGKYVKRGDSVLNVLGFGDKLETISPKVQHGVFLHKYVKSNGMTLTDDEITSIINKNKSMFLDNGKMVNNLKASEILDSLLSNKYEAQATFRIQDVFAAGLIKPTTSSTEKGMTNLNYIKTGSLDKKVNKFFRNIGFDNINQGAITEEGLEAIIKSTSKKKLNTALKNTFGTVEELKQAINIERNQFNEVIYDKVFNKKTNMLVNDGVFKHGGSGQLQFGILNKAIDNLIAKNNGNVEETYKQVTNIINSNKEYQFLQTINLNTNKVEATKFSIQNGRIHMDDMGTNIDNLTISNIKSLENLVEALDPNLVHKSGYIQQKDKDGKIKLVELSEDNKLFGEWISEEIDGKQVFTSPITKESVKLLPDVETQTGTESRYFELKETLMQLKARKDGTGDATERQKIIEQIGVLEKELKNYESVSKRMSIGTTEYHLLERIKVTDKHAENIQELIAKGTITDEIIASEALKGKIHLGDDGKLKIDDSLKAPTLSHWLDRFKGQLTFNPLEEFKLTEEDLLKDEYKHLSKVYDRAIKYGKDIGVDSAQKIYQLEMADMAVKFNKNREYSLERLQQEGFEVKSIGKINFETDEIAKKNLVVDLGEKFGKDRYIAVAGTGHVIGEDEEILTNGQKQIRALKHRYEDWQVKQHDEDLSLKATEAVYSQVTETKEAIRQSIYGKNAYSDSMNKIQVDDINYRYKASGAVTSELTPGLSKAVKSGEYQDLKIDNELLDGSYIDGKSLSQWHKEGRHYDYKFVSLEAMEDQGMFKKPAMKAYGASTKEEMIQKLKSHGTMDITDRYPNNKNDSMLLTHVFLDETLEGNQTKVAGVSGLKMLLDHDGDSVSSFALRYKTGNGEFLDFGSFVNNPEYVKGINPEAYETFSNMLGTTSVRAMSENHNWLDEVNKILAGDAIKGDMGKLSNTALVPNGTSALGKIAPAALSQMGSLESANANEEAVNSLLINARAMLTDDTVKTSLKNNNININIDDIGGIISEHKSEEVLDKALTVLEHANRKGLVTDETLNSHLSNSLRRIGIDKAAIAASAKTGVATTGGINVATNSVKLAARATLEPSGDVLTADLISSVFDIPEQEAISSKKIKSAYNDTRARDMSEILNDMFDIKHNRTSSAIANDDIKDLTNWFSTHAKGKVEDIYNSYGKYYLDESVINQVETGKLSKFDAIMQKTTTTLQTLSNNEEFQAKRINLKTRNAATMGATSTDSFVDTMLQMTGHADDSYKIRQNELDELAENVKARQANAKKYYSNPENHFNGSAMKQGKSMMSEVIDTMSHGANGMKVGSGLGMAVLGLASGLMVSGYAAGNPLNDKSAQQVTQENIQPTQTMSIPDFMDKQGGYVTGNSQQGYIINIKADTKKGRKHMQRVMKQAAETSVGGAVSVNMNIRNSSSRGISDSDIENFLDRHF